MSNRGIPGKVIFAAGAIGKNSAGRASISAERKLKRNLHPLRL
jgi:hypothetical protein